MALGRHRLSPHLSQILFGVFGRRSGVRTVRLFLLLTAGSALSSGSSARPSAGSVRLPDGCVWPSFGFRPRRLRGERFNGSAK